MSSLSFRYLVSPYVAHEQKKKKKKKKKKERDEMTIPVVKETYHTQCVAFMCNRW
jgi:hypothetical protein